MTTDVRKNFNYLASSSSVVCIVLILSATVSAELPSNDPCLAGTTVTITFKELDPPGVPVPDPQRVSAADSSYIIEVIDEPDYGDGGSGDGGSGNGCGGNREYRFSGNGGGGNREYRFSDYFRVQYTNGWNIENTRAIDRDGQTPDLRDDANLFQYSLRCMSQEKLLFSDLKIRIDDLNDNSPQFLHPPYSVTIRENTPPGLTIYNDIIATDLDVGPNKQIIYSLSNSPGAQLDGVQYLGIGVVGEGYVVVKKSPDYESLYAATNYRADKVYFNLTVTATDQGSPYRSNTTNLIVYITDDDDQGLQFLCPSCVQDEGRCVRPRYKTVLSPNASKPFKLVLTPDPANTNNPSAKIDIIVQDRDTLNSSVNCSIIKTIPGGFESKFRANASRIGVSKQYKCTITYLANGTNPFKELSEIEIVVKAQEQSYEKRSEYGSVIAKIFGSGSTNTGTNSGGSPGDGSTAAPKPRPPGFTEK